MPSSTSSNSRRPAQSRRTDLDPYGIYGARTANRQRALQRRRQHQEMLLLVLLGVLLVAAVVLWQFRRVPTFKAVYQQPLQVHVSAPPALIENNLLIPTESGQLLAVDTGTIDQHKEPRRLLNVEAPLRAQPVLDGQTIFTACEEGVLYALDFKTGRQRWKYTAHAPFTTRPALLRWTEKSETGTSKKSLIFAGNDAGLLAALDANSGREVWRRRVPVPIGNALAAVRGRDGQPRVLVPLLAGPGSGGGVWCFDARNGKPLWKFPASGQVFSAQFSAPLVVTGQAASEPDSVFIANDAGTVYRLNLQNGEKIWKTFAEPLPRSHAEEAVVLRGEPLWQEYSWGQYLFVGGQDGGLRCFDAKTGKEVWTYNAGFPISSQPQAWTGDRLLVGGESGHVIILDARSGSQLARLRSDGDAFAGALPIGDRPCIVSRGGTVQLYPPL